MFCDYLNARCSELRLKRRDIQRVIPNPKTGKIISYPSVRAWFTGTNVPTYDKLKYLAPILRTTVAELEDELKKDFEKKASLGQLRQLTETDPEVILLEARLAETQAALAKAKKRRNRP